MKKNIILIVVIFMMANILIAKEFIPAKEMNGYNLKFRTFYYNKFDEFDIDFTGFMVSYPRLSDHFAVEADFRTYGDEIYRKMNLNFSLGYRFNEDFILAVSGGGLYHTYDTDNLDLFDPSEEIPNDNAKAATVGLSLYSEFFQDRLMVDVGVWNLNKPNISLYDDGDDKDQIKVKADANWKINESLEAGVYYEREDEEDYYGVQFTAAIGTPAFKINTFHESDDEFSNKKVTIMPEIDLINYWNFKVGYDYYYGDNEDMNNTNYYIEVGYELPNKKFMPIIVFEDKRLDKSPIYTFDKNIVSSFSVENSPRLRYVTANFNNNNLIAESNLREHDNKKFNLMLGLVTGENNLTVATKGITGGEIYKKVKIIRKEKIIEIADVKSEIKYDESLDIGWRGTLEDGVYNIFLMANEQEIKKVNAEPIPVDWTKEDKVFKKYMYTFKDTTLADSLMYNFKIRNDENDTEAMTNSFAYIRPEPEVVVKDTVVVEKPKPRRRRRVKPKPMPKPEPEPEVIEEPEPEPEPMPEPEPEPQPEPKKSIWPLILAIIGGIGLIIIFFLWKRRKNEEE